MKKNSNMFINSKSSNTKLKTRIGNYIFNRSFAYFVKISKIIVIFLNLERPARRLHKIYQISKHHEFFFNVYCLQSYSNLNPQFDERCKIHTLPLKNFIDVKLPNCKSEYPLNFFEGFVRLPSLYIAELNLMTIIGNTVLILDENYILSDEIFYHDYYSRYALKSSREILNFLHLSNKYAKKVKLTYPSLYKSPEKILECGIHLLHDYSSNFYHFLIELIPRIFLLNQSGILDKNIPILIDEKLPKQFFEIMRHYLGYDFNYVEVKKYEKILVKKLIFPSFLSICHDLAFDQKSDFKTDFLISPLAVHFLQQSKCSGFIERKPFKKIFIKRSQATSKHGRILLNSDEIEEYLIKRGFDVILPETLTFLEQQQNFSDALIIVSPGGAALANLVFCQKNTKILMLSNDYININPYIFSTIAQSVNVNLKIICGETQNDRLPMSDFLINLDVLDAELFE